MSTTDTNNVLLREQLGKGKYDNITTETVTGKDYYAIYFPVESVITTLTQPNALTGLTAYNGQTMAAGTVLHMRVTGISLTSGLATCYIEHDGITTA